MPTSSHPLLYQLNTRIRQYELSREHHAPLPLDEWPDTEWDRIAELGFNWVWLLGIWETGTASRHISRTHPDLRESFRTCLPDLSETDICGSCFAITRYQVDDRFGGKAALQHARHKLNERNLRLMLDFVPNHTALDHSWAQTHPDFYIRGTQEDLEREPQNYTVLTSSTSGLDPQIFAHGRDPSFDGWSDTLQLDYSNPAVQQTMMEELLKIAECCDGVRCDMAMLLLPQVFERTWHRSIDPFWSVAIPAVRRRFPQFLFLAEVYWDLEWTLQQNGFDYTYDKRLYDRLLDQTARPVRDHLAADTGYQRKMTRFLENHDERRAAAIFPSAVHEAAALINYLAPGMRFFHAGQLEGKQVRIPVQLCRSPDEPANHRLISFYQRLLQILRNPVFQHGTWTLLEVLPAGEGDDSWNNFIVYRWQGKNGDILLVIVNYASYPSQCQLELFDLRPDANATTRDWRELITSDTQSSIQEEPVTRFLLQLPAWGYHILEKQAEST